MSSIYCRLPNVVSESASVSANNSGCVKYDSSENFFKEIIPKDKYPQDLKSTAFPLSKWLPDKKSVSSKEKKHLSYKEKRRQNLLKIKEDNLKYEDFIPMHNLWLGYIKNVLNLKQTKKSEDSEWNLLKADYHGCRLLVSRAKDQALVGITGIVIRENKNCFILITKENKIKCIPKQNCVFNFMVDNYLFTLFGNHIRVKTAERKAKNFKPKSTIDL